MVLIEDAKYSALLSTLKAALREVLPEQFLTRLCFALYSPSNALRFLNHVHAI
jgi:hypothetical protein